MSGKYWSLPRKEQDKELLKRIGLVQFFELRNFRRNYRRRKTNQADQPPILTDKQVNRLGFLHFRIHTRKDLHPGQD